MMYLKYVVDVVIAAILVGSVIRGFRRGFIKTVFSCFAVVVALGLAYFFGPTVGNFIRTTDVYANVEEKIDTQIEQYFESKVGETVQNPLENGDVADSFETLKRLGINVEELYGNYENAMTQGSHNLQEGFSENVAEPILRALSTALGAIAVFILALIALKLISLVLGGIFSLPVLKQLNHVAGLAAGAVFGVLMVFALCLVIEVVLPYIPENPVLYMGMDKDTILYGFFVKMSPMFFLLFG